MNINKKKNSDKERYELLRKIYEKIVLASQPNELKRIELSRLSFIEYLDSFMEGIDGIYTSLSSSFPWIVFWVFNCYGILTVTIPPAIMDAAVVQLGQCQSNQGGFCGEPLHAPHLGASYAAVSTLCMVQRLEIIHLPSLVQFLKRVRNGDG